MGKFKGGPNKSTSENPKKPEQKKVLNPFEVHVNRQKFQVLGRKLKNDRGLPGVSRAKAIKKRKETLLQEYKVKDKSNKFMDRRIGERNSAMTREDRITARFTAEKIKAHKKKTMFNLADDEVLTHRGQTLNEIEKFDDPRSDDDDDDDDVMKSKGNLDSGFVGDAHFGGGLFSRSDDGGSKSRKDLIDQLITESKKRKAEKQKQREQTLDLTEKLDGDWKDLLPLMASAPKAADVEKPKPDSYDIVMRELKFEARGQPTDRLKSADEIALEDKKRLEELEAERVRRMHGVMDTSENSVPKHRSADDLDDGFEVDELSEGDEDDDGVSPGKGKITNNEEGSDDMEDDEMEDDEMNSEEEESHGEGGSEEDGGEEDDNDDDKVDEEENDDDNDDDDESGGALSDLDDLKYESSSDEDVNESQEKKSSLKNKVETQNIAAEKGAQENSTGKIREELQRRKELMESARKELPYTYEMPATFKELQRTLSGRQPEYQGVIIERMIKCSHPSLAEGNKEKLASLFAFLMQHLHDTAASEGHENVSWAVLNYLAPHLFDLMQWCPDDVARCIRDILQEKQQEFRSSRKQFPGVETLIFFKVISLLFPTSDFRHPVVTPALVFMSQMLSTCHVRSRQSIARGLLLVSLILEYTALSKRFSPECINFLRNLLYTATSFSENQVNVNPAKLPAVRLIPPFKMRSPENTLLRPQNKNQKISDVLEHLEASDLTTTDEIDDTFRYTTILVVLRMTSAFLSQLSLLSSCRFIFSPFTPLVNSMLEESCLPDCIIKEAQNLKKSINAVNEGKLEYLVAVQKRPKPLKLYEPKITQVYADGKQRRPMSKEKQDHEKLLHRYKRERKGALREIRKDRDFLAKIKIKQQWKSDAERRAKVKEIFGDASMQQGEMNKLSRSKKK